jgi:transposase
MNNLPDLSQLTHAEKDALILELFSLVQSLRLEVATLRQEVRDLKDQLAKKSHNSGKPPSSDGYAKPKPKSLRTKSGRKSGGQPGHEGNTLMQVETPDKVEVHRVATCKHCGFDLTSSLVILHKCRQVFELPEIRLNVTEHLAEIKLCPNCQKETEADFPEGITQPVQYGARVQALAVYFNQYQYVPYLRVQEIFHDLLGAPISQGTLANILVRAHDNLSQHEQDAKEHVVASSLAHFDETGMRVNGKLHWLHIASTNCVTHYEIHEKRGGKAMEDIGILPRFKGTAVHDHWSSYFAYGCEHSLCNAHHLRELLFAEEEYQQRWANQLATCLTDALKEADAAKADDKMALPPERVIYYERRYSRILREGKAELPSVTTSKVVKRGRKKQHKVKNLHDRLRKNKAETLRFISDFSVPFDNNQAERDARMAKLKQKVSGCFRSFHGAEIFCRIRGYVSTARKQGKNTFESLTSVFSGEPVTLA